MSSTLGTAVRSMEKLYVGGRWVDPASDARIEVVSPTTEEVLASVPEASRSEVDAAVAAARRAFDEGPWPRMSPAERAAALRRVADEIDARLPELTRTFTEETGATVAVSEAFTANASMFWRDAAAAIERYAFETSLGGARVFHEPLGVAALVTPWNAPAANASIKLGPALGAGCTAVLKPAPEGPVATFLLAEAIEAAGLPEGVVSILPADREVGEHLVTHPGVDKVSFTGSTAAGRRIMSLCGDRITRVTLELGGKSAGIVAEDVDPAEVLPSLLPAGFGHSGQVCVAITRILVPRSRHDEYAEAAAAVLGSLRVGDPRDPDTVIGPLVAERQRARVEEYLASGREQGAVIATGGGRPAHLDKGWFVEPTLFTHARNDMRIAQEEIFGPVLTMIPYDGIDEAIRFANDSAFGLAGSVYTKDPAVAEKVARSVRTGQISVNTSACDFSLPFGGFKQSGLGREGGVSALEGYLETKVVTGL